jgi:hypothetical protein
MEEYENYESPQSRGFNLVKKIISTAILVFIFAFIAALILRIAFADFYPKSMTGLYFTDPLAEHYRSSPDTFAAYSHDMDSTYTPDADKKGRTAGDVFAAGVVMVPDADALQLFVRFNRASCESMNQRYELSLPKDQFRSALDISLFVCYGEGQGDEDFVGESYYPTHTFTDKIWIYDYEKMCFDGVELEGAYWMRLEIRLSETGELLSTIPIYSADADERNLEKIKFKESQLPQ